MAFIVFFVFFLIFVEFTSTFQTVFSSFSARFRGIFELFFRARIGKVALRRELDLAFFNEAGHQCTRLPNRHVEVTREETISQIERAAPVIHEVEKRGVCTTLLKIESLITGERIQSGSAYAKDASSLRPLRAWSATGRQYFGVIPHACLQSRRLGSLEVAIAARNPTCRRGIFRKAALGGDRVHAHAVRPQGAALGRAELDLPGMVAAAVEALTASSFQQFGLARHQLAPCSSESHMTSTVSVRW